ncbi:hypothetical protein BDW59DRAFT_144091 [Aspergillus cavernicola]|uniref:Uncharacterized protein n=1 Tax=Aspergillus cavernicola TaxID=176166 RepID=A0ABR4IIP2_9EURO
MRCGHDLSTISRDPWVLRFGIVYSAICITCICVFAWRIRRGQRRRYMLLGGQMDPPSEKSGGEQSSGTTSAEISYDRAPLPSACDILQPLSHSSPLPPSGYLAAVLGQERRNMMEQAYQQTYQQENRSIQSTSSPSSPDNSPSVASRTNRRHRSPPSGTESSPTQADNSSQATPPQTERGAGTDDQGHSSSPDSGENQSIQKRNQRVEILHDVDEEGVRTWRRWVVEYS